MINTNLPYAPSIIKLALWLPVGDMIIIVSKLSNFLRLYKTPTHEKILSFKRPETCPIYTRRCNLWF